MTEKGRQLHIAPNFGSGYTLCMSTKINQVTKLCKYRTVCKLCDRNFNKQLWFQFSLNLYNSEHCPVQLLMLRYTLVGVQFFGSLLRSPQLVQTKFRLCQIQFQNCGNSSCGTVALYGPFFSSLFFGGP